VRHIVSTQLELLCRWTHSDVVDAHDSWEDEIRQIDESEILQLKSVSA
jgi:hypothetical protein